MSNRAVLALAALALVGAVGSTTLAQPPNAPGPPRDPGPPEHVGNLPNAALAQRIRSGGDAVFIFIVRKSGDVDLLTDCRPQCDARSTDGMIGGPVNVYRFQKFIATVGEDPCVTWTDASGTLRTRRWS